ncbi:MAG: maltooligosyltrehalose trehalohydrolase, partial [Variibacter sp.]|nr:maltooligosyltrehalose trehalohydrolase [Variibacter sp.]
GVHFRVWAPKAKHLVLVVDGREYEPDKETEGYYSALVPSARAGSRYGYRIDDNSRLFPDSASRSQPEGPHEASCVVDPSLFAWSDAAWPGVTIARQVVTEVHLGTFTPEGTYRTAIEKLPLLADAGITLIELMPVAEFPGRFGWGYDGVGLFAPTRLYGEPDDLRAFIEAAHGHGVGVIHDVVYNHFGPDGNYMPCFSDTYLTDKYDNEWGDAINFDGPGSAPVREFIRENAAYWIREFHFDGLRLDATQQIFDDSPEHIVAELTRAAREAAGDREIVVIAENEPQHATLVRPREQGGYGLDAIWNDDFHHTARIALTGQNEAYYTDYTGSARELAACAKHGFLYQGQRSAWQKKRRGIPARGVEGQNRISFLENHDQIANSDSGKRLVHLTDRGRLRAMTALMMLAPGTPMLFQGQEFASSTPFLYFADHKAELAQAVAKGRREFLSQFLSVADVTLDLPHAEATPRKCVLDWSERERNDWALRLHRDLSRLKREDATFAAQGHDGIDVAALNDELLLVRFDAPQARLLVVNLGSDLEPRILPEPLLAPPEGCRWKLVWASEHPEYGGRGMREPETSDGCWFFQGPAASVLAGVPADKN